MTEQTTPRISALWRYPVKSLRGEELNSASVEANGILGDRLLHVRQADGRIVTSRFRPKLLGLDASLDSDGAPLICGLPWSDPTALSLVRAASSEDVELHPFRAPDLGQRFDVLPLTILTDGMVEAMGVDYRRFRPNIMISGVPGLEERAWVGQALQIGTTLIGVRKARERCVMTTFHPDTLEQDPSVLRKIVKDFESRIALDCWVIAAGTVSVGDPVRVLDLPPGIVQPIRNAAMARAVKGS